MATEPTRRLFTVDDYHRMVDAGILRVHDHVELLDGEIIEMTPTGSRHSGLVTRLMRLFILRSGDRAIVRTQHPVILDDLSEPEPDLSICSPRADDYMSGHPRPSDILLIVEVSDSSLAFDRGRKAVRYAAVGVPELWIIDLQHDVIEVFREPGRAGYEIQLSYRSGETFSPSAFTDVEFAVSELIG